MRDVFRLTCLIVAAALMAGCTGLFLSAERPRINLSNIQPKDVKLLEQVFTMDLRIQNPSESAIDVKGLAFDLEINNIQFATGVSNKQLTIQPFTSQVIQVEAVTTLANLLRQVSQVQKSVDASKLKYRLKGTIHTGSTFGRIPFDESGEIAGPQQ
ncbi:MAG: LEA type 2 family protein [Deltaproteobacteria bacterium]|nr:LEA type 2 family protein [Deltaproteobacteria bacterium]